MTHHYALGPPADWPRHNPVYKPVGPLCPDSARTPLDNWAETVAAYFNVDTGAIQLVACVSRRLYALTARRLALCRAIFMKFSIKFACAVGVRTMARRQPIKYTGNDTLWVSRDQLLHDEELVMPHVRDLPDDGLFRALTNVWLIMREPVPFQCTTLMMGAPVASRRIDTYGPWRGECPDGIQREHYCVNLLLPQRFDPLPMNCDVCRLALDDKFIAGYVDARDLNESTDDSSDEVQPGIAFRASTKILKDHLVWMVIHTKTLPTDNMPGVIGLMRAGCLRPTVHVM